MTHGWQAWPGSPNSTPPAFNLSLKDTASSNKYSKLREFSGLHGDRQDPESGGQSQGSFANDAGPGAEGEPRMVGTHIAETSSKVTGYLIGFVKRVTPTSAQPAAASLFDSTTNLVERVLGWREELTPPLRIRLHIGPFLDPRLYRFAGERNVKAFRDLAGLKPDAAFLDIGCGCGRVARALTGYFGAFASYEGFDAAKKPVEWAHKVITPRFPNFHFQTADTFNKRYNPSGKTGA